MFDVENPEVGVSFAEAVVLAESKFGTIGTVGSYSPPRSPGKYKGAGVGPSPAYSYSAAVAEVDVDPDTGIVIVERVWIAHDIGKSINPMLVMGQVEGSVYMGLGEILMEEMAYRGEPQRRAQVSLDARIQEPDDDGDVRRQDLSDRRSRSEWTIRREGSWTGTVAAGAAGGRQCGLQRGRRAHRRSADHAGESFESADAKNQEAAMGVMVPTQFRQSNGPSLCAC